MWQLCSLVKIRSTSALSANSKDAQPPRFSLEVPVLDKGSSFQAWVRREIPMGSVGAVEGGVGSKGRQTCLESCFCHMLGHSDFRQDIYPDRSVLQSP